MDLKHLRDRGTIKWTAMMLPEHVKMLREALIEEEKIKKPLIDEYELQEFEERIHYAKNSKLPVKLTVWKEGFVEEVSGLIYRLDVMKKDIWLKDSDGDLVRVSFSNLMGVSVIY